ncbi:Uncharacterised protein [Bordetella pertussis]|nr:Uncharacterised protein [Bordetella pertussis]
MPALSSRPLRHGRRGCATTWAMCSMKRARHRTRAQARQVAGLLLAIDPGHLVAAQESHQVRQGDLGGVGGAREHRFAIEHVPQADAVQAAGQLAVDPGFDAVHESRRMPAAIGLLDGRADPGAGLAVARRGALVQDPGEGRVDAHLQARGGVVFGAGQGAQALAQRVRGREVGACQHHARVRAPPQDGFALRVPGENAVRIGLGQPFGRQVGARGQQSVGIAQRLFDRGKRRVGGQPGQFQGISGAIRGCSGGWGIRPCAGLPDSA